VADSIKFSFGLTGYWCMTSLFSTIFLVKFYWCYPDQNYWPLVSHLQYWYQRQIATFGCRIYKP